MRAALDGFAPDLVHVTSPGTLGRKALKHARRAGVPTLVVEQSAVLDQTADYWRTKVAERADRVVVTSRWMRDRVAGFGVAADLWTPGRRHRRLHPGPARPVAARLLVAHPCERGRGRRGSVVAATSEACTSGTAYAGWPSWPRCPASARS